MKAVVGDRLVVKGHHLGEPDRDGEILEVHGGRGTPPYLVRWSEDGHVGLVFPGPDAQVEHLRAARRG
ncbi:MAG TPA: DUF1918 domain-containing protein [Acidimicrobiales bacterium]|nr:DUF1918 domain-containing protein [Acidimicrobiales bacterium]